MREILVRDLAKCINCGTCVTACETRHGRARMTMSGPRYGRYQLPNVCRHCPDTPCVAACHLGGMRRDDGKTFVSDACRGCKKCAQACRYGVIEMLPRDGAGPRGLIESILALAWQTTSSVRQCGILTDATRCVQCGICSTHCPAGISVRDYARQGLVMDHPACIGCGLCIAKCPRGTLRFETYPRLPRPKFRADKCDLCRNYRASACVQQCPTAALMRLPADQTLATLNASLYATIAHLPADETYAHPAPHHRERGRGNERSGGDSPPLAPRPDHNDRRRTAPDVLASRSRVSIDG
ncbi:MAG: 4Fe-4S dicluster domain-containing protein [Chloroflexi bacterium]|nr:4Fe-4S dicluster domain-containing protein [Chloroflexota bacterium]